MSYLKCKGCDCCKELHRFQQKVYSPRFMELKDKRKQNKKMRECLEWYGDESNWGINDRVVIYSQLFEAADGFERAQKCLEELDGGNEQI